MAAAAVDVTATIDDFVRTLSFGPDCIVDNILAGGTKNISASVTVGHRLTAINSIHISNRVELKALVLQLVAGGAKELTATFEEADSFGAKVSIEDSVIFDGAKSEVEQPDLAAVRELKSMVASPGTADDAIGLGGADDNALASESHSSADLSRAGSDPSLCDFNINDQSSELSGPEPDLPVFEKIKTSVRAEDSQHRYPGNYHEVSVKGRIAMAVAKANPDCCVLCVVQDVNPLAEIELLAMAQSRRLIAVDLGVKLRLRPQPEVFAKLFTEAMHSGAWFVVVNAHKSINTCLHFSELLEDARKSNAIHTDARIIVGLEPHPHFPPGLLKGAVVMKLVSSFQGSAIMSDSMATSMSRIRLVTANEMTASQLLPAARLGSSIVAAQKPPAKKRVRISAAVDIVDIAPREVTRRPASREAPIDVYGTVALLKSFTGVLNDQFLCVKAAGEPGRFAVGSSLGNVYFLDSLGNSLLQAHAHNASIWDVSFQGKYEFATGSEDGTVATWSLRCTTADLAAETSELTPTTVTTFGADIYSATYLKNQCPSPIIIGGLQDNIVIRVPTSDTVNVVPIQMNAQVIDCLPSQSVALVGSGDGSVSVVDVDNAKVVGVMLEHSRKVPALTVRDDNQFFTGSFDSSILSWDLRIPGGVTSPVEMNGTEAITRIVHTLQLKNYVTGLHVDGVHLAASVGENLYLWDVRKLNTVLGGYAQCWKGLSRGICVQSMSNLIVTASPDRVVRFWNFVS